MSWMQTPNMFILEKFLDLTAFRQTLIASNLANIETPGYRTLDFDFQQQLRRAEQQWGGRPEASAQEVAGLIERPDGNNVNLERESMMLAETQLRFRIATELLRAEVRRVRTAIHEGRG